MQDTKAIAAVQTTERKREPAKRQPPKRAGSMAEFVDGLLMEGVSWEKLASRCKAEAAQRGTTTLSTIGMLKSHVRYRASQTKRWKVEISDSGVRMNAVGPQPKVEKPKAQPRKTGKPVGRRTRAVKENGRQTVEPVAEPVADAETVEAA